MERKSRLKYIDCMKFVSENEQQIIYLMFQRNVFISAVLPPVLVPRQQDMPTKVPDAPSLDDLGRPVDNITISQEMSDQGII